MSQNIKRSFEKAEGIDFSFTFPEISVYQSKKPKIIGDDTLSENAPQTVSKAPRNDAEEVVVHPGSFIPVTTDIITYRFRQLVNNFFNEGSQIEIEFKKEEAPEQESTFAQYMYNGIKDALVDGMTVKINYNEYRKEFHDYKEVLFRVIVDSITIIDIGLVKTKEPTRDPIAFYLRSFAYNSSDDKTSFKAAMQKIKDKVKVKPKLLNPDREEGRTVAGVLMEIVSSIANSVLQYMNGLDDNEKDTDLAIYLQDAWKGFYDDKAINSGTLSKNGMDMAVKYANSKDWTFIEAFKMHVHGFYGAWGFERVENTGSVITNMFGANDAYPWKRARVKDMSTLNASMAAVNSDHVPK